MPKSESRDVLVVRVSERGDREDELFHSPEVQIDAATRWAENRGERIVAEPFREIDVSGKLPLAKRPGLLAAIEMVEGGEADHIVVAYFDRLVRSLKVQLEVIERVEKAGGEIFALDHGKLTNGTAATRLSTNMMGAVFQYFAEVTGEKVTAAQARAVARGVYPHPKIPVGYVRGEDGVLVIDAAAARIVVQAFERRDRGASVTELQAFLAESGIERSIAGVASMLRSRMYLGEIHFGELHNLAAHEPIITDRALFERVQRRTVSRGRQPKSERLLSRLGVLRCGSCGSRMVINTDTGNYRCGDTSASRCERRVAVKADRVEALVMDAVDAAVGDREGRASRQAHRRESKAALERLQGQLDTALRRLLLLPQGSDQEAAVQAVVVELTRARDQARARLEQLGPDTDPFAKVATTKDLTLAEWRDLVRATVESVTVAPASSRQWDASRVTIKFFLQ